MNASRRAFLRTLSGCAAIACTRTVHAQAAAGDLPPWVPAPGKVASISANTLAALDPCGSPPCTYSGVSGQKGVFAFSGGAFADDCGRYGAYVMTGGGHTDYHGNEVYVFGLEERRWRRISEPYPSNGLSLGRAHKQRAAKLAELARHWPEFDTVYGDYDAAIPEPAHTYDFVDVLPAAAGGGVRGSLIRLIGAGSGKGSFNFRGTHVCDLANGRWSRYALAPEAGYVGGAAYDARRKCFYMVCRTASGPTRRVHILDTATRRWRTQTSRTELPLSLESAACIVPPADLLLYVHGHRNAPPELWALPLDVRQPAWVPLRTQGAAPQRRGGSSRGFGLAFCPPAGALYCVPGSRDSGMWRLEPPSARHLEGPWTWERETLDGVISTRHGGNVYDRLRYAAALKSFVWVDGVHGDVQLIRPAAAV